MRGIYRSKMVAALCTMLALLSVESAWAVKGKPVRLPEEMRRAMRQATPAAGCETVAYDDGIPAWGWSSPDKWGDTMQFVRFSPAFVCTLKTVQFWVSDDTTLGAWGKPGVIVDIYSTAGGFPDTLVATQTVPYPSLIQFPGGPNVVDFSSLNLTFGEDFCVVLHRSGLVTDTMVLLSDESSTNSRSGEYYVGGGWELLLDGWGGDYDFLIRAELCCGDPPSCTPGAQPDWDTYGGSFARTFKSNASVNNECRLTLNWITQGDSVANASNLSAFSNVVVKDSLAFLCFWNYLACFDVRTGAKLWTTARDSFPTFGQDMRCNVTVDDSLVYLGGGGFRSFNCVRVADGSVVWSHNTLSAPAPLGNTKFCPSVVHDSVVYMASERVPGEVFAFNKYTGTLFSGWVTNPRLLTEGGVFNGLTSDGDSLLFVGSVAEPATLTNGRLYAIRLSDGTIKWGLEDPSAKFLDPTLDREGFSGFLSYENGILYYQSNIRDDGANFDHFPWDGSCGAVDVNLEDGTGAGILWVAPAPVGRALYGGPVIGEGLVYVGNDGIFVGADNPKGVIALNKTTGARVWYNPLDGAGVPMPLTLTCEPSGHPYLFAGTRGGLWYLIDGFTGDVVWSRIFSGLVHGTVALNDRVLVSTRSSLVGNTNGQLASFTLAPADRPRMNVHQLTVFATNALPGSGNATTDTIVNALSNVGCANLTIANLGIDTVSLAATAMPQAPDWAARAIGRADRQASQWLAFADALPHRPGPALMKYGLLRQGLEDDALWKPQAREFARRTIAAAAPHVVTVENTTPVVVAPGGSLDLNIRINETGQTPRTTVRNYITLDTDDPDFFPEDTANTQLGLPVIAVDAIFGYARQQDTLRATDALSQVTNHGAMGVNDDAIFYVEGDNTASLFDGTFMITGKIDDTARTAWDVYDWLEFQPDDFLTVVYDTALATTTGSDQLTGSVASAQYVDSIGFPDSTVTHALGVTVRETQVGFNNAGSGAASFKLVGQRVVNRSATAIDSPLYIGTFTDFDVASGNNNVDTTYTTAWSAVYEYDPGSNQAAYGIIKLPKPGTIFRHPDGTLDTATGFRSVYAVFNADEVYPDGLYSPIVDHIYTYASGTGLRSRGGFNRNADMSMACTFDRVQLAGYDTAFAYYAVFGHASGGNLDSAALTAAVQANLMAGFMRGDVNGDGSYNFLDLVWLYDWVQSGGTSPSPIPRAAQGDVNADGSVTMADVTYLENFLYNNGPAPVGQWWW
jgi:hypothetical protein